MLLLTVALIHSGFKDIALLPAMVVRLLITGVWQCRYAL